MNTQKNTTNKIIRTNVAAKRLDAYYNKHIATKPSRAANKGRRDGKTYRNTKSWN